MYVNNEFSGQEKSPKSIAELVEATPELTDFFSAVKSARFVDALDALGKYTVFAPNNDAFAKLGDKLIDLWKDVDKLTKVVRRHIVKGNFESKDIPRGVTVVQTFVEENIPVLKSGGNKIRIISYEGSALVIKSDMMASNGVVHIVDDIF